MTQRIPCINFDKSVELREINILIVTNPSSYSWGHLVVPYTEELISRPFLDENSIWRLFWDRVDPWPAAGCFFPALCHFCIGFHWIAKSHGAGTVFSGGFVSKTLRWICQGPFFYLLHLPPHPQLFRFEDQSNILICLTTTRSCFINLKWFFLLTFWNFI